MLLKVCSVDQGVAKIAGASEQTAAWQTYTMHSLRHVHYQPQGNKREV